MSCNPFFTPISIYSIYLSIYMSTYLSVYLTNLLYLMLSPIIKYYSINLSHLLSLLLSLECSLLPHPSPVVGHAFFITFSLYLTCSLSSCLLSAAFSLNLLLL